MKKMEITINENGTTDIDLQEGFSGMSCVEKSKQIELIIGGEQEQQEEKPEYYDADDISIGINLDIQH